MVSLTPNQRFPSRLRDLRPTLSRLSAFLFLSLLESRNAMNDQSPFRLILVDSAQPLNATEYVTSVSLTLIAADGGGASRLVLQGLDGV
jgi:hypothetical protein